MKNNMRFCLLALLPAVFLFLQGAGCPKDNPTAPPELTTQEIPRVKVCSDFTTKAQCEDPAAVPGKVCVFMGEGCVEDTAELKVFMGEDRSFETKLVDGTGGYGLDHGETMNWPALCGENAEGHNFPGINNVLNSITFSFQKNTSSIDLVLDCKVGGKQTYELAYRANTLADKSLLIKFVLNGNEVRAKVSKQGALESNQLEFFTKPNWFYTGASIAGISLLHDVGFTHYGRIDLENTQQLNSAMTYLKGDGNGYEAGNNVGAITLILNKK